MTVFFEILSFTVQYRIEGRNLPFNCFKYVCSASELLHTSSVKEEGRLDRPQPENRGNKGSY